MTKHPGILSNAKQLLTLDPKGQEEGAVPGMKLWEGAPG